MNIKKLICYLKAIPFWFRMKCNKDFFIPHVFRDIGEYPAKIFVNKKTGKFRVADSYAHEFDEEFKTNAKIIGRQCKYCGYVTADYKLPGYKDNLNEEEMRKSFWNFREKGEFD